jgi:aspartyl-tRNA(Asn)/glutamyl-tRNA(Gln) amidotransferase subunit C
MSVDTATVARIASLARIKVTDEEIAAMVPELNGILAWVEQLGEVNVEGIAPMTAVIRNKQRLRDDVVGARSADWRQCAREGALQRARGEHGFFGVPEVIE